MPRRPLLALFGLAAFGVTDPASPANEMPLDPIASRQSAIENLRPVPMKRLFFKTCPKSGRIVALNWHHGAPRILLPVFALLCVGWFLLRVVPRPSRLAHPCQQIAAPVALQTLAWLAGTLGLAALARKLRSPRPPDLSAHP